MLELGWEVSPLSIVERKKERKKEREREREAKKIKIFSKNQLLVLLILFLSTWLILAPS